jgi:anti-sigma factor RsiW
MKAEECRRWRQSLGAYTLGQLDADEQAAVEAHLESCSECRADARSLAPLSHLLSLADPRHLEATPAPPPGLGDRVAAMVAGERGARRRRRRRRTAISLAGAAAAAAVVVAAIALSPGEEDDTAVRGEVEQRVSFRSLPPGAAITAELEPARVGTVIRVGVDGLRPGTLCRVFLRRDDGRRVPAGSFRYSSGPGDDAVLTSGVGLSSASALVLVAGRWTYTARLR